MAMPKHFTQRYAITVACRGRCSLGGQRVSQRGTRRGVSYLMDRPLAEGVTAIRQPLTCLGFANRIDALAPERVLAFEQEERPAGDRVELCPLYGRQNRGKLAIRRIGDRVET